MGPGAPQTSAHAQQGSAFPWARGPRAGHLPSRLLPAVPSWAAADLAPCSGGFWFSRQQSLSLSRLTVFPPSAPSRVLCAALPAGSLVPQCLYLPLMFLGIFIPKAHWCCLLVSCKFRAWIAQGCLEAQLTSAVPSSSPGSVHMTWTCCVLAVSDSMVGRHCAYLW